MNFINPIVRRFLTQHRNDDDFTLNPTTDFTSYMQMETIEKSRLDVTYKVYTITVASALYQIRISLEGAQYVFELPVSGWTNEGFVVGNSIRLESGTNFTTATVDSIVGGLMYVTAFTDLFTLFGFTDGDLQSDFTLKVITPPTSLKFRFGLIPNSLPSSSFNSLLDGQEQLYSLNTVSGSFQPLNYLASESSNLGGVEYRYIGASGTGNYIFEFEVRHVFRFPHFIIDWLPAYESGGLPSAFAGSESFRYLSQLEFSTNILNPNAKKIFTDDFQFGSVGFRNQNFNGGDVDYIKVSTDYDTGEAPEVTETTTVTAQIKRLSGNFITGVKAYLYHSKASSADEYSTNDNTFETNFVIDQLSTTDAAVPISSTIINNFTTMINVDPTMLDISFELTYNDSQQLRLLNGDRILLELAIEDSTLTAEESDRVLVELDSVLITKNADIPGLASNFQATFNERASLISGSNIDTWVNRMVECEFSFDLTKELGTSNALINSLRYDLVAWNTATDEFFSLDNFTFPLGLIPVVNVDGTVYQILNLDTTRFLSVPESDQLREVQVTIEPPAVFEATQEISGKYGFIIPWQQWKENLDVPLEFYNGAIPDEFFNRNDRTSNYSGELGFRVYIFLTASIMKNSDNTNYTFFSDECPVYDFNEDGDGTEWAHVSTKFFNMDGEEMESINTLTLNKVEIIMSNPDISGITPQAAQAEIITEPFNNTARHFRLHSNLDFTEDINPLEPETGETGVKIVLEDNVGTDFVTLSCLVDGAKLDPTQTHNFYGHILE